MGGAGNIRRFLELFGPQGLDARLAGLCDAREEGDFRRGLERAGLGSDLGRAGMAHSGRKIRYARLLVDTLDLTSVPRPLARVPAKY